MGRKVGLEIPHPDFYSLIAGIPNMSRAENETSMTDVSNGGLPLSAPSFLVYDRAVVSVEHPFVIQNLEKGIASLGSQRELMLVCRKYFE